MGQCESCEPWDVGGLTYLAACCQNGKTCGVVMSATAGLYGCYPINQPGALDSTCPAFADTGGTKSHPGCCRAATGTCGAFVAPVDSTYPSFGCSDVSAEMADSAAPQPCGGTCASCKQLRCAQEMEQCMQVSECREAWLCISGCSDAVCADTCAAKISWELPKLAFDDLEACFEQECQSECQ